MSDASDDELPARVPARTETAIEGEIETQSPLTTLQKQLQLSFAANEESRAFHKAQLKELAEARRTMVRRHRKEKSDVAERQARELEQLADLVGFEENKISHFAQALMIVDAGLSSINAFASKPAAPAIENKRAGK